MMRTWIFGVSVVFILTLSACATSRTYVNERYDDWEAQSPPPASERAYRVFLIGDAGGASFDPLEPALGLLKSHLDQAGERAAVVFLGDNLYCCGLSDSGTVRREIDEQRLRAQLEAVKDFEGRIVFLPGNHDWNNDLPGGLEALARQERFVEDFLGRGNVFLPDDGFPGPVEVELTDRLTLIVLDTAWWIYEQDKSFGDTGEYDLEEDADFLLELDDLVKGNDDKDLLVVGHHPLFSNGPHAGILPLSAHLFPLRKVHPALVIPLPLIGSIYPLFARFNGGRQNLSHPRYRSLRV
ncbi:MAG: metallophosphoesterase, partial [Rhodothermales bacterium]